MGGEKRYRDRADPASPPSRPTQPTSTNTASLWDGLPGWSGRVWTGSPGVVRPELMTHRGLVRPAWTGLRGWSGPELMTHRGRPGQRDSLKPAVRPAWTALLKPAVRPWTGLLGQSGPAWMALQGQGRLRPAWTPSSLWSARVDGPPACVQASMDDPPACSQASMDGLQGAVRTTWTARGTVKAA